jgi:hypothetical protein
VSGADPSSVPRNVGQGQRFGRVAAVSPVAAPADGRERLAPVCHFGLEANIGRSTLEVERSHRGENRSFPEARLDDPCHQGYIIWKE